MKRNIISLSLLALALSACEDYNEQFDITTELTDVKNMELTLSKSDYASIAGNSKNKALAESLNGESTAYTDALNRLKTEPYFNELITADLFIPAFLADKYPYADPESKFVVKYNNYTGQSAYMADFTNISSFTLNEEAYSEIWGNKVIANFATPNSENKIANILSNSITDASEGDMIAVNYAYSPTEPSIGGGTTAEPTWTQIASIPVRATGNSWDFVNVGPIDLSAYAGQTVNIGFKYTSSTDKAGTWEVKNFTAAACPYLDVYAYAKQDDGSFSKVAKISGIKEGEYIFAAMGVDGKFYPWGRITGDKNYGYMAPEAITITDNVIAAGSADDFIVTLDSLTDGFSIKNALGKFLYQSGSYDSFNVSDELPTADDAGCEWTISSTGSDQFVITNIMKSKSVKLNYYKGSYSFGSYADTKYKGGDYVRLALSNNDAEGFTINDVELGTLTYVWSLDNKYGYKATAFKGGAVASEAWLISPSFTIEENAALPYLSVDEAINYGTAEDLTIWVSTDYNASGNKSLKSASEITPNKSVMYRFNGEEWTIYNNNDVTVTLLQPSDYEAIGSDKINNPENILPLLLSDKFTYAENISSTVVIYNNSKDNIVAEEYILANGTWSLSNQTTTETTTFTKNNDNTIEANVSSFYENTLLGDEGGFTVQDIILGDGISYVWTNTTSYGWKATGYLSGKNTTCEAWVISPVITLKKAQKPVLTFDEAHRYLNGADPNDFFAVMVSTDYTGDATKCTWEQLNVPQWSDGATWDFINIGTIDLSKYSNQTIVIGFLYKSNDTAAATWEFKNIKVVEESVLNN